MRIPRTRGAVTGALLIVLGAWGALIPFVGPSFDFVIGNDRAWDFTAGRFWLSLLPGATVVCGGLLLVLSRTRASALLGAWLAMAGGAWFVVGGQLSALWNGGTSQAGEALGGTARRVAEQLAYFDGLGALIVALGAIAFGRLAVRSVRDAEWEEEIAPAGPAEDQARRTRETARFDREPELEPAAASTDTLTAADRVRVAADQDAGRRGFFARRR
jgi:hypothetical protein